MESKIDLPNEKSFDIVSTYRRLIAEDPDLTMPIAAIEALVEALSQIPTSTVTETLMLLSSYSELLKSSISNPIALSAGTDLFQRYLVTSLQRSGSRDDDFHSIRKHLLTNGRLFISRAQEARQKIAAHARHFVRDGSTVLTFGGSRVVGAVLQAAAENCMGNVRFRVIYVLGPKDRTGKHGTGNDNVDKSPEGCRIVSDLRSRGVPIATIPDSAVGYALGGVDMVIVGAEGVVESGGIISRLGTYQIGMLAKAMGKPFYVVAESHKFVRIYPLGQYDMLNEQRVVEFHTHDDGNKIETGKSSKGKNEEVAAKKTDDFSARDLDRLRPITIPKREAKNETSSTEGGNKAIAANDLQDAVDFTVSQSSLLFVLFSLCHYTIFLE